MPAPLPDQLSASSWPPKFGAQEPCCNPRAFAKPNRWCTAAPSLTARMQRAATTRLRCQAPHRHRVGLRASRRHDPIAMRVGVHDPRAPPSGLHPLPARRAARASGSGRHRGKICSPACAGSRANCRSGSIGAARAACATHNFSRAACDMRGRFRMCSAATAGAVPRVQFSRKTLQQTSRAAFATFLPRHACAPMDAAHGSAYRRAIGR